MKNKEDLVSRSESLFEEGFGCAEAVLMTLAESRKIHSELIPRIATGLCGGMGKTNGTCGAVTGSVLALSLLFGRDRVDDPRDELNEKIGYFVQAFQKKYGTTGCTELTGCNLGTEMGMQRFQELNHHVTCRNIVGSATAILLDTINQ